MTNDPLPRDADHERAMEALERWSEILGSGQMTFTPTPGGQQFEDDRPGHPRYSDHLRTWYYFPEEVRAEEAAQAAAQSNKEAK